MSFTRRLLIQAALLLPLLLGIGLLFLPARDTRGQRALAPEAAADPGDRRRPERLLFLLQYIGTDYPGAVAAGEVVSELEYQEMLDFSKAVIDQYREIRPAAASPAIEARLERLRGLIARKGDPEQVLTLTRETVELLVEELGVVARPMRTPDLARGRELYRTSCAQCHGAGGGGAGPSSAGQDPPPTSFREPRMNGIAPHQIFNAVSFGVAGTAMPSFQDALGDQERWDLAFFLLTLRDEFRPAPGEPPLAISLEELAALSNEELSARHRTSIAAIDHYRQSPPETDERDLLRRARRMLEEGFEAYRRGDASAALAASYDAYLENVEPVEFSLRTVDNRLVLEIERGLVLYRSALKAGEPIETAGGRLDAVIRRLEDAEDRLATSSTRWGATFLQSLAIILREGIEAALLLGVLAGVLSAAGYGGWQRYNLGGAAAGLAAGVLTWVCARYLFQISSLEREALEGITSLLAAAVLFSVSYWVIHRADVARWKSYIQAKAKQALGAGSGIALAAAAFLAVYREAFETVLFYQALWIRSGDTPGAILAGFAAGLLALGAVVLAMFRYGMRVPLRPFFTVTGILLAWLSFAFAGYGVSELQAIGWIKATPVPWHLSFPLLEIQSTVEGLALQLGIFLSFLLGWFQTTRAPAALGRAASAA